MSFDYLLVGGGLQNALVALTLLKRRAGVRLALIERESHLCGNHAWCFHENDIPRAARDLVLPLVTHLWPVYEVAFPGQRRTLHFGYASVSNQRLEAVLRRALDEAAATLITGVAVTNVDANSVLLADGRRLVGRFVIDARGPSNGWDSPAAYQKFVGLELELPDAQAPAVPLLMDATVAQIEGMRFVYVLPLAPNRVLVEDTYYTNEPHLDVAAMSERVLAYAAARGWSHARVARREQGVLPLPLAGGNGPVAAMPLKAGYGGGWFHPTTGYSLPLALRLALALAASAGSSLEAVAALAALHTKQAEFLYRLNRLLFLATRPSDRWRVLARFYQLPEPTLQRFFALELTAADRLRILSGRPPVGVSWRDAMRFWGSP